MINLDRCNGNCNTFDDPSGRICVPNNIENVVMDVFNMITKINPSKTLTRLISCKCKCKFDDIKFNSNQKWNNYKC